MTIKYLTAKDVLFYHDIILKDTVEDQGIAPHTSIESALHRIDHHITYDDLDDIYEIAALYGVAIAKGHCFNNGNKRTSTFNAKATCIKFCIDMFCSPRSTRPIPAASAIPSCEYPLEVRNTRIFSPILTRF